MTLRRAVFGMLVSSAAALVLTLWTLDAHGAVSPVPVLAVALLVCVALAVVVLRMVEDPVHALTRMARALAAGDVGARVDVPRDAELGALGEALNRVAEAQARHLGFMRTEEARLTTVLDGMVEAVFVTDGGGEVALANRAFRDLVGSDPVGRKAVEIIETPALREALWAALRGESSSVNVETAIGGEEHVFAAQVAPLPEGRGAVAVLHDVTELKRVDRIRRDFVANASHELRTPLTAIRGFAETLQGGALARPDQAARFVDKILIHSLRLQRLADDLIALSRAETPSEMLDEEPVVLGEMLHAVVSGFEGKASAKGIRLHEEYPAQPVEIDTNFWALEHVLMNLVDNAIKYTPEGGEVFVRLRSDDGRVAIEVADTGAGIPKAHQDRIFERFYRMDSGRSRDQGGSGLGLAIVKHLCHRLHAEIRVESEAGKGAAFIVAFPRRPRRPSASGSVAAPR